MCGNLCHLCKPLTGKLVRVILLLEDPVEIAKLLLSFFDLVNLLHWTQRPKSLVLVTILQSNSIGVLVCLDDLPF